MNESIGGNTGFGDILAEAENCVVRRLGMNAIDELHNFKSGAQRLERMIWMDVRVKM